jgi:hypothetical protein
VTCCCCLHIRQLVPLHFGEKFGKVMKYGNIACQIGMVGLHELNAVDP